MRFFLFLTLSLLALPLAAQEGPPKTSVRFVSFPERPDTPTLEIPVGKGKTLKVELPSHTLSQEYKLPRLAQWQLGETQTGEDGEPVFQSYGKITPKTAPRQIVLVLLKDKKKPAAGLKALSFAETDFKGGQFLIMNFSPQETAAEIGGKKFRLKPGRHQIIEPKENRGQGLCFASLFTQKGEQWRPFFTSNWPVDKEARGLVFLYQRPGGRVPSLHTIVDYL